MRSWYLIGIVCVTFSGWLWGCSDDNAVTFDTDFKSVPVFSRGAQFLAKHTDLSSMDVAGEQVFHSLFDLDRMITNCPIVVTNSGKEYFVSTCDTIWRCTSNGNRNVAMERQDMVRQGMPAWREGKLHIKGLSCSAEGTAICFLLSHSIPQEVEESACSENENDVPGDEQPRNVRRTVKSESSYYICRVDLVDRHMEFLPVKYQVYFAGIADPETGVWYYMDAGDLWSLSLDGATRRIASGSIRGSDLMLSSDRQRLLVYDLLHNEASSQNRPIFLVDIRSGVVATLPIEGGYACWGENDGAVYYLRRDYSLWRYGLTDGKSERIMRIKGLAESLDFAPLASSWDGSWLAWRWSLQRRDSKHDVRGTLLFDLKNRQCRRIEKTFLQTQWVCSPDTATTKASEDLHR